MNFLCGHVGIDVGINVGVGVGAGVDVGAAIGVVDCDTIVVVHVHAYQ